MNGLMATQRFKKEFFLKKKSAVRLCDSKQIPIVLKVVEYK